MRGLSLCLVETAVPSISAVPDFARLKPATTVRTSDDAAMADCADAIIIGRSTTKRARLKFGFWDAICRLLRHGRHYPGLFLGFGRRNPMGANAELMITTQSACPSLHLFDGAPSCRSGRVEIIRFPPGASAAPKIEGLCIVDLVGARKFRFLLAS